MRFRPFHVLWCILCIYISWCNYYQKSASMSERVTSYQQFINYRFWFRQCWGSVETDLVCNTWTSTYTHILLSIKISSSFSIMGIKTGDKWYRAYQGISNDTLSFRFPSNSVKGIRLLMTYSGNPIKKTASQELSWDVL